MEPSRLGSGASVAGAVMRTSIGVVRERNEDAAFVDDELRYFVVADGMGGHAAGDVASALAVSTVRDTLDGAGDALAELATARDRAERVRALLERAVRAAHVAIGQWSQRERDMRGMGTTVVVLLVVGDEAFIAHAGDSRAYLIRDRAALRLTVDHTLAQALMDAGSLSPEEGERSSLRCTLSNALGVGSEPRVDHERLVLRPGDRVLLCTDGLYDYFDDDEIARRVTASASDVIVDGLIHEACARGGHDNATGLLVEMTAAPGPRLRAPSPLVGVPDSSLSAIVDRVLREESEPVATTIFLEY